MGTVLTAGVALAGTACVTTEQTGPSPPQSGSGPERDLPPDYMVLFVDQPSDIDGDRRPDRLTVELRLFARAPDPVSVAVPGSIEIEMSGPDGSTLKVWSIPQEHVTRAVQTRGEMARYLITLFLPGPDAVRTLPGEASLRVRFDPVGDSKSLERYLGIALKPR